jgi:hypothetical protein
VQMHWQGARCKSPSLAVRVERPSMGNRGERSAKEQIRAGGSDPGPTAFDPVLLTRHCPMHRKRLRLLEGGTRKHG